MTEETNDRLPWRDDARAWAQGRDWRWRAVLMAYLAYTALRGVADPESWSWWAGLTLGVHEAGHIIFSPFGEFLAVAGGSITQLAAPVLVAYLMRRQHDWFGVAVGGTWLGSSLASLATYIGDARAQELQLVGFTDNPEHDWHYLLGRDRGCCGMTRRLAGFTRFVAVVVIIQAVGIHGVALLGNAEERRCSGVVDGSGLVDDKGAYGHRDWWTTLQLSSTSPHHYHRGRCRLAPNQSTTPSSR